MLNYGAAAQKYMNYHTDALCNEVEGVKECVQNYATAEVPAYSTVQNVGTLEGATSRFRNVGLILDSGMTLRFRFTNTAAAENLRVKYFTDEACQNLYDEAVYGTTPDFTYEADEDKYTVLFSEYGPAWMATPLYVAVYDGDTQISGVLTYSIESFAYSKLTNANTDEKTVELLNLMLKYGAAAKAYAAAGN